MSISTSRDARNRSSLVARDRIRTTRPTQPFGPESWKIVALVITIGLIVMLVYYAESRSIFFRYFSRLLFIVPIALAAYNFGITGGLSTALFCTAVFFPIVVEYTSRFGLTEETLEILSVIAFFNVFAFIVANLADFQRKQERLYLILDQVGGLFEQGLDVEQLAAAVLRSGMEVCGAEFGEVVLQDEATGELQVVAQQGGIPRVLKQSATSAAQGTRLANWLIAHNQAMLVNQMHRDLRFMLQAGSPDIRSFLAVPLSNGSDSFGFVALMNRQGGQFTADDLEILKAIAEKSEMAIENARLYQQTDENLRRRVHEFAILAQLSVALSSTLDLEQSLQVAVAYAAQALKVPICDIRMVEGDYLSTVAALGTQRRSMPPHEVKIEGRLRQATEEFKPLVIPDVETGPALPTEWYEWFFEIGARSYLGVPMISHGSAIGMLGLYRRESHTWLPHEINFARTIANTVASAIDNARLFEIVSKGKRWTELVLNGIADGVVTTNRDCLIRSFNPAAERITGWPAEEIIGRNFCDVFGDPDACTKRTCAHWQALSRAEAGPVSYRTHLKRRDGTELTLAITVTSLSNQLGESVGTVSIIRDVSEEERLDQMKSDFVSMVSHELRAPLTNIMASVDVLKRSRLEPGDKNELIAILDSESRRLNRFVEDILSASRLENEPIQVHLRPVTLRPLLSRTISAVRARGVRRELHAVVEPYLPYVLADESKLETIIHNLLKNAIEYSSPGSKITIEARETNESVVISISDEGMGIAAQDQKRIFERFYRTHTGDSRKAYGYGLGLYICKKLVEAQGGYIWVESQEGVGSRFSFALPCFPVREEESV
ncbi:MAG: GAF domain-containing protein [Chloroflexi bacterium]|nr:MAG: GAF domain-containing protein [Chloroflexota bacterium]